MGKRTEMWPNSKVTRPSIVGVYNNYYLSSIDHDYAL